MAYRMTEISDTVRAGITSAGDADIEIWDRDWRDPDSTCSQVLVPAIDVADLGLYLVKAGR